MENNSKEIDITNCDISSPWYLFYKEMYELFKDDPEVKLNFYEASEADNGMPKLEVLVDNLDKADALERLLLKEKIFGGVMLKIVVIPPNYDEEESPEVFKRAFKGNPALDRIETNDISDYVVFRNQVVQYFADNIDDIHGFRSTLYEEIAREVFGDTHGVFFCTGEPIQMPSYKVPNPFNNVGDEVTFDRLDTDLEW